MDVLLESPLAVAAIGSVLVAMAAMWFFLSRTTAASVAVLVALLLTAGAIAFKRWCETPREAVGAAVRELFDAIAADDLPRVLRAIDPLETSGVRADAETLMPMFRVESAGPGGDLGIEVTGSPTGYDDGATAEVSLRPVIRVTHEQSGVGGAYLDSLTVWFVRRDGRWLVEGYQAATDWRSDAARLGR